MFPVKSQHLLVMWVARHVINLQYASRFAIFSHGTPEAYLSHFLYFWILP